MVQERSWSLVDKKGKAVKLPGPRVGCFGWPPGRGLPTHEAYPLDLYERRITRQLAPEPSTLAVSGLGGVGLLAYASRRRRT